MSADFQSIADSLAVIGLYPPAHLLAASLPRILGNSLRYTSPHTRDRNAQVSECMRSRVIFGFGDSHTPTTLHLSLIHILRLRTKKKREVLGVSLGGGSLFGAGAGGASGSGADGLRPASGLFAPTTSSPSVTSWGGAPPLTHPRGGWAADHIETGNQDGRSGVFVGLP